MYNGKSSLKFNIVAKHYPIITFIHFCWHGWQNRSEKMNPIICCLLLLLLPWHAVMQNTFMVSFPSPQKWSKGSQVSWPTHSSPVHSMSKMHARHTHFIIYGSRYCGFAFHGSAHSIFNTLLRVKFTRVVLYNVWTLRRFRVLFLSFGPVPP